MTEMGNMQLIAESVAEHGIVLTSGSGASYFRPDGTRAQVEGLYVVRIKCRCGWRGQAPVGEIDALWAAHIDGTVAPIKESPSDRD